MKIIDDINATISFKILNPTGILIHPETWETISKYLYEMFNLKSTGFIYEYRNLTVYRSEEIEKDTFKII